MFGIGLPEMILIMALALIVIGPDKLPDLARSLAKTIVDLKKTAEGLKEALKEDGNPLDEIRPDLEEAARNLRTTLLESPSSPSKESVEKDGALPAENAAKAYQELMARTVNANKLDSQNQEETSDPTREPGGSIQETPLATHTKEMPDQESTPSEPATRS
jgi:sec-independent protein translocase protein TatB